MKISDVKPGDVIVRDYDSLLFYYIVRRVSDSYVECLSVSVNPRKVELYSVSTMALLNMEDHKDVVILRYQTAKEALCTGE